MSERGGEAPRDDGTLALLLAACSPVLSAVVLLLLVLARVAWAPLPRACAWLVLLPQSTAALLALRALRAPRARAALALAAAMALLFGLRLRGQAEGWACAGP